MVRQWFKELQALNLGATQGEGRNLKFKSNCSHWGQRGQVGVNQTPSQNQTHQDSQPFGVKGVNFNPFLEKEEKEEKTKKTKNQTPMTPNGTQPSHSADSAWGQPVPQADPNDPKPPTFSQPQPTQPTKKSNLDNIGSNLEGEGFSKLDNQSNSESNLSNKPTDQLKVGDRVAYNDPTNMSYNWHGTIVRLGKSRYTDAVGAEVRWDERKGMKGGEILFHRLEGLRLI